MEKTYTEKQYHLTAIGSMLFGVAIGVGIIFFSEAFKVFKGK